MERSTATTRDNASPARLYCLLVGGVLVFAGILGFFYEASFAVGNEVVADKVLGLLAVNGWHNLVHLSIGAVLLLGAGAAARATAMAVGILYLVLTVLGFIATGGDGIEFVASNGVLIDLVPVNDEDNILHLVLGLTGVIAAVATGRRAAPATA
jgi:hypothetical protein